ncbi:MAG: hypothetical protein IJJ13_00845 [Lachnospiraceae bacterium]|nr:hypothetical protein [Lachnospiraceae bacterium]
MKLIGNLKEQVAATTNKAEAKEVIAQAGMELTDDEMDQVSGGDLLNRPDLFSYQFSRGERVIYRDERGNEHPAQVERVEGEGWTMLVVITVTDGLHRKCTVHPNSLRHDGRGLIDINLDTVLGNAC